LAAPAPDPGFDAEELEARLLCLDPIELRLITARWGLDFEPLYLHQLAEQEAISEREVRKVLAMAMAKMRGDAVPVPVEGCQLSLGLSTLNP
jgi:DNA-directed RNA polymerase sigma subunit (sigma70/sigma32)